MAEPLDEPTFRRLADRALEDLQQSLIRAEEQGGFETESNNAVLNVVFDDGATKFVFTPQTPVRQIWISARTTSFKLDWSGAAFTLTRTGESLLLLTQRLLREQLADSTLSLS